MDVVSSHILKYVDNFVEDFSASFETIFREIQNENKDEFRKLLIYINNIIEQRACQSNDKLECFHLHFAYNFEDCIKSLIAEFIVIKSFFQDLP